MKIIIIKILIFTSLGFGFHSEKAKADPLVTLITAASTAEFMRSAADFNCKGWGRECHLIKVYSSTEVALTISMLLLREIEEVRPDAINYLTGGEMSPTLLSAIEKLQEEAIKQGVEISQDLALDLMTVPTGT